MLTFRLSIPDYDRRAFREALVNALVHRDYSRLGTVFVKFTSDDLTLSNPGGFVEGVTLNNILSVEPSPRNPSLADALKRIGLSERTGRGVDRIFEGMLRFGRPAPDYSSTTESSVVLRLQKAGTDFDFVKLLISEEGKTGKEMPVDALIVLSRLKEERRLDISELSKSTQKPESQTRSIIERLVERGLIQAHGQKRGRTYTLSAKMYSREGQQSEYVRQKGFEPLRQENMVLEYLETHGRIKRGDVMELCAINKTQAYRLLKKLEKAGKISQKGKKRYAYYILSS